uniref:Uncharacterized protein n=1 Tax=Arundo donax TaxID=35708 RepID=A0A0A8YAD2_ARUDO
MKPLLLDVFSNLMGNFFLLRAFRRAAYYDIKKEIKGSVQPVYSYSPMGNSTCSKFKTLKDSSITLFPNSAIPLKDLFIFSPRYVQISITGRTKEKGSTNAFTNFVSNNH